MVEFIHVESLYPTEPTTLPPVLLVHGAANASWVWRAWLPALASLGWETHALDLRGHGASAATDLAHTSMLDYTCDVEDVAGRHPHEPWQEEDLSLVIAALKKMAADLTPSPIALQETAVGALRRNINGWHVALLRNERRLDPWCVEHLAQLAELEAEAPQVAAGETLLHFDTRADNILIADDRVYVVDWPNARIGAAWVDWVAMAPSVAMQGGPDPETFLNRFDVAGIPKHTIDAVLCSIAGYFVVRALEPSPPGLPTVRAFQAAQGVAALKWLRERTGWT